MNIYPCRCGEEDATDHFVEFPGGFLGKKRVRRCISTDLVFDPDIPKLEETNPRRVKELRAEIAILDTKLNKLYDELWA